MSFSGKKYHLLAELLSTLHAEGYPLGAGQQLQLQELLNKLPEDTRVEEMPYLLAPLFAGNPREQAHFYELFEQCRRRTEAFYRETEREDLAAPDRQERRYRGLIWLLALLLLIPPAIVAYQLLRPVERDFIEKPFQVQAGGKAEVCLVDSTDLRDFGLPESFEVLYAGRGGLGAFLVDTLQCLVYIAQDSIEGQDSIVVEWSNARGQRLAVNYKPIISLPEPLLPEGPVEIIKSFTSPFELLNYPSNHDPLALAMQPPSALRRFLADNFRWLKWGGLLLFTALLLAVMFYRAYRRRKLVAELESKDKPPYAWNIRIEGAEAIQLGDDFSFLLNLIRQRTGSEAFRLDVPKTIGATIEQGGMPTFRFLQQTQPPEYLLLIDQQSARNHRARLLDLLFRVFHANEVLIERFFYDNDPRVCYNELHPEGITLPEVQQRYPSARLIIAGYGNALLNKLTGRPETWSRLFRNWKHRLLLTPRPIQSWGKRERRLSEAFTLLPLSMQSLLFWLEELEMEEDARFDTWPERVKDAPRQPIELNGALLPGLHAHFGEPMLQWIAACAVYPSLHWDLTLYLGQQLSIGGENLLTVDRLLQLTRLSWFTEGRIPPAARAGLLSWLEAEHPALLERARVQLGNILRQNPPPADSAAFEDYRMNVALNEWLTTKNRRRKKELEKEIGNLMEAGAEADVTVIKQLQRERSPLDFIVPDNWKKYLHPHGLPGLGWRGEWRDVLRWALPLWLPALLATAWPWQIRPAGCEGVLVEYQVAGTDNLLCINDLEAVGVMVEAHARAAVQADSLSNASAFNAQAILWQTLADAPLFVPAEVSGPEAGWQWRMPPSGSSPAARLITYNRTDKTLKLSTAEGEEHYRFREDWTSEYRRNMAIAFYNKGAGLYQSGYEFFALSPAERQAQLRDALEEWAKLNAGTGSLPPERQAPMPKILEYLGLQDAAQLQSGQLSEASMLNRLEQQIAEERGRICAYFQEAILLDSTELPMNNIRNWCAGEAAAGTDSIPPEACYIVGNLPDEVALRSRILTRAEADELNAQFGKPGWNQLRVNRQTLVKSIPSGERLQLLEEGQDYYRIRHKGVEGYIVKSYKGKPVLAPCPENAAADAGPAGPEKKKTVPLRVPNKDVPVLTIPEKNFKPPVSPARQGSLQKTGKEPEVFNPPIQQTGPKAYTQRYLWCLDNPHGSDTPGKRSPVFDDGKTQLFEGELARDVVDRIIRRLEEIGVAYYRVVPEEEDISLQERARRINSYKSSLPKMAVSVHFNAAPPQEKDGWARADLRGAEAWHYSASRDGRRLGAIFLEQVIRKTGLQNRFLKFSEGGEFYLLRSTAAPVAQVENGFYNNRLDAALLAQPAFRQKLADAYVEAIQEIEAYGLEKTPAPLIDEQDSDGDGLANSEDLCPFTAGMAENKGCPGEEQKYQEPPQQQVGKAGEFPKEGRVAAGGRTYRTIQFEAGGPAWLAENLDVEVENSWCYDNISANCDQYGRLYTWEAAREACQQLGEGWRLPTDEEWGAFIKNKGGEAGAYDELLRGGGNGFDALLGGYRFPSGGYNFFEINGYYWSSTEKDTQNVWSYYFNSLYGRLYRYDFAKSYGISCRCLKN